MAPNGRKHSPETKAKIAAWHIGKKASPETRAKISAANKGRHHTPETKQRMSESHKGKKRPPEVGDKISRSLEQYYSDPENRARLSRSLKGKIHHSEETRRKISEKHKGMRISDEQKKRQSLKMKEYWAHNPNPNKGKHPSEEAIENNRKSHLGKHCGKDNPMWGRHPSEETRKRMSAVHKGRKLSEEHKELLSQLATERYKDSERRAKISGPNASNWRGGMSFQPYCPKFNNLLKESVRDKFNRKCALCGRHEDPGRKLDIHHIDYNKLICYYLVRADINLNIPKFCDFVTDFT